MKSYASQLLDLCRRILMDAAGKCYAVTVADWPLDFKRLESRVKHEGISFLTITLPTFGQAFEKCLAKGKVDSTDWPGWTKSGCLPTFLRGFTSLVFEQSGCLREEPDVAAIEGIRQIAYTFKKIELACTPERELKAIMDYLSIEHDLEHTSVLSDLDRSFDDLCQLLWGSVFGCDVDFRELYPKHGPGATAEGIRNNRKYLHRSWYDRLQAYFPFDETAYHNTLAGVNMLQETNFECQEEQELAAKLTLVLKTLKTPRVIVVEPVAKQYTQQALSAHIIKCIGKSEITGGHINFNDQSVNQRLAVIGSQTGEICTLDLSAASDWVPLSGVERMLSVNPDLLDSLKATRSTRVNLPTGITIQLRKFASMGSATCFPIEAMWFFSLITWGLWRNSGHPLTLRVLKELTRNVYVYGDDIIAPTDKVDVVLSALAAGLCKVGPTKSFWTGKFRESCGADVYDGEVVTPTYLRTIPPENKRNAREVISWTATSNLFYQRGYWQTANYMRSIVESVVGRLPLVRDDSPGLGWVNFQQGYSVDRWNKTLHRYEVRTYVPRPSYTPDPLEGYPALMKCLLSLNRRGMNEMLDGSITTAQGSFVDKVPRRRKSQNLTPPRWRSTADRVSAQEHDHLHRSARFGTVSIKRRWTTPY